MCVYACRSHKSKVLYFISCIAHGPCLPVNTYCQAIQSICSVVVFLQNHGQTIHRLFRHRFLDLVVLAFGTNNYLFLKICDYALIHQLYSCCFWRREAPLSQLHSIVFVDRRKMASESTSEDFSNNPFFQSSLLLPQMRV